MSSSLGYFGLVLHGHIPWSKRSGTWPAGEEWVFEAMHETYIPMLNTLRELKEEGINTAITINITPILAEQLADEYMKHRFEEYMNDLIRRAQSDINRFSHNPQKKSLAELYKRRFEHTLDTFYHNYYRDILGTFKWLEEEGMIELITCAATHGFLPLFKHDSGIFSQIQTAVDTHKKYFGRHPRGIWLPECAYRPKHVQNGRIRESIDYWVHNSGIDYFFVDSHGILDAEIIESKNDLDLTTNFGYQLETGVCVFGRNQKSSRQVWDSRIGYPGAPNYREFHKKDARSGLHYWKITEKARSKENKELYNVEKAQKTLKTHAAHFMSVLKEELSSFSKTHDNQNGIIVSPYDFELYGHWWAEGINWLKHVFRLIQSTPEIEMISFSDYVKKFKNQFSIIRMEESSWGKGGHFEVWKNSKHGWIWPYINSSINDLEMVLAKNKNPNERGLRILQQTARELLLMEGSDWPFLLYTKQAKEYANERFHHHHQRFNKLIWAAKDPNDKIRLNTHELEEIEEIDSCFQELNLDYFRKIE
ncbi:MAG: glycoside hydrolase family 57 protein [Promethearchaeia archaeon]